MCFLSPRPYVGGLFYAVRTERSWVADVIWLSYGVREMDGRAAVGR